MSTIENCDTTALVHVFLETEKSISWNDLYLCFNVQYVTEKYLQDHPQGLKGMFAKVLEFVPKHCKKLQEAVAAPVQGLAWIILS